MKLRETEKEAMHSLTRIEVKVERLMEDRDRLRAGLEKARKTLEFYEDGKTWNYDSEVDKPTINPWETRAGKDQGKRARAALSEIDALLGKGEKT